ncbi:hypothetical protein CJ263_15985 [Maribacter cobaltidurans]|uniref:Uncharacterized protein n=2 Tax=Flavobacteriaceae TaxID=49546 RepID=A0A223V858_9FLAO|nr:hypothetical protein CJ263_15985 [Maribacter cobaltidurans]GGD96104.1 hypothetical protein GCM10011412_37780 [Maribacter cobaltidurans]
MIGHDIVPHTDVSPDGEQISFSIALTADSQQIAQEHSELSHIFEHFQHSSNERTLKYVTGATKHLNFKTKILQNAALIIDIDNQFIWHANFEKQRFRDYPLIPYFSTLSSHTLRGPPSC